MTKPAASPALRKELENLVRERFAPSTSPKSLARLAQLIPPGGEPHYQDEMFLKLVVTGLAAQQRFLTIARLKPTIQSAALLDAIARAEAMREKFGPLVLHPFIDRLWHTVLALHRATNIASSPHARETHVAAAMSLYFSRVRYTLSTPAVGLPTLALDAPSDPYERVLVEQLVRLAPALLGRALEVTLTTPMENFSRKAPLAHVPAPSREALESMELMGVRVARLTIAQGTRLCEAELSARYAALAADINGDLTRSAFARVLGRLADDERDGLLILDFSNYTAALIQELAITHQLMLTFSVYGFFESVETYDGARIDLPWAQADEPMAYERAETTPEAEALLDKWTDENEHRRVVEAMESIPPAARSADARTWLARGIQNLAILGPDEGGLNSEDDEDDEDDFGFLAQALLLLISYRALGGEDAETRTHYGWIWRQIYAHQYLEATEFLALPYLARAVELRCDDSDIELVTKEIFGDVGRRIQRCVGELYPAEKSTVNKQTAH